MWSKYQQDIFDFVTTGSGDGVVIAVAGSGKSTTGVESLLRSGKYNTKFLAFNKHIADDINSKLMDKLYPEVASTYNSYGNAILRMNGLKFQFDEYKTFKILRKHRMFPRYISHSARVIGLLKNLLLEPTLKNISFVCQQYDIDLSDKTKDILVKAADEDLSRMDYINYDDQKYVVVRDGLEVPQLDLLLVDEFQDSCPLEIALLRKFNCRKVFFGDPWQAIYDFKGTDPSAIEKVDGKKLPLSVCYRCPVSVVEEARTIVDYIEPATGAAQGIVDKIDYTEYLKRVTSDDLVLCRVSADLLRSVITFLKKGIPAHIHGREVLNELLDHMNIVSKEDDVVSFLHDLDNYTSDKVSHFSNLGEEQKSEKYVDLQSTLHILCEGCYNVKEVVQKIENLTNAKNNSITHMTIHKSKGLEGKVNKAVYLLNVRSIENERLRYVAITRSRGQFFYVNRPMG